MPDIRRDPLNGQWTIFTPERERPPVQQTGPLMETPQPEVCPLCPGNEALLEQAIYVASSARGDSANAPWTVRVVPNRFPILRVEGELNARAAGLYDTLHGVGAHEILIESPNHDATPERQTVEGLRTALEAAQHRHRDLRQDGRLAYIHTFKNAGALAGAALEHPHMQLIATPVLPPATAARIDAATRHFAARGRSLFADIVQQEIEEEIRVVEETSHYLAFCPYASPEAFQVAIFPKRPCYHFDAAHRDELHDLATLLIKLSQRLATLLDSPAYNWVIHTGPLQAEHRSADAYDDSAYSWHMEIIPRLRVHSGFDLTTGMLVNSTLPETAAKSLRNAHGG